jgi:choline dehydrogenase-like flavoprotein
VDIEGELVETSDVWEACGYCRNKDISQGDPIGLMLPVMSGYRNVRSTSADLLEDRPSNLDILTEAQVHRVDFDGQRAVGITMVDGRTIRCSQEVILCAGSIDSPKILLHSGIGPVECLEKFGIPVVHENRHIGQNMRDHYFTSMSFTARPDSQSRINGPGIGCHAMGFFKNQQVLASREFDDLPSQVKRHLELPTVPTFEMVHQPRMTPSVPPWEQHKEETAEMPMKDPVTIMNVFLMNAQSRGEVTLKSADPSDPPAIIPRYLAHPYDRRVVIEATRECLRVLDHPASSKSHDKTAINHAPNLESDEDILGFWRQNGVSSMHMSQTCMMGKSQDDGACVDSSFRVFGVNALRVADMSVVPLLPK